MTILDASVYGEGDRYHLAIKTHHGHVEHMPNVPDHLIGHARAELRQRVLDAGHSLAAAKIHTTRSREGFG